MKSSTRITCSALLLYSIQTIFIFSGHAAEKGKVDYALQWGSGEQLYTYVFSGVVTCKGHPCVGAEIQVNIENSNHPSISEMTRTSTDGRYLVQISLAGTVEDSALWKLLAHASGNTSNDPVEVEGRAILMPDETTVLLERPIQIVQS